MSHKYAIKRQEKTLGIHDDEQLIGLIRRGKIKPPDRVFVLETRQWVSAGEISAVKGFFPENKEISTSTFNLPVVDIPNGGDVVESQAVDASTSVTMDDEPIHSGVLGSGIHKIENVVDRSSRRTMVISAVKNQKAASKQVKSKPRFLAFLTTLAVFVILSVMGILYLRQQSNVDYIEQLSQVEPNTLQQADDRARSPEERKTASP